MMHASMHEEPVRIEYIDGPNARHLAHVAGWTFTVWSDAPDGEPRLRDIDGAERLRLSRPRNIRKTIKRLWPDPKSSGIYVRSTTERSQTPTGGTREYVVEGYWLTEAQWLKVIARCETEVAEAILDEMIRVYMLARRGLLRPAGDTTNAQTVAAIVSIMRELLAPLQQQMSMTQQRMAAMETRGHAGPSGTMGNSLAAQLRRRLRAIADCYEPRATPKWHSQRMKIEHRVMRAADLPKRAWEQQDPSRLHAVLTALEEAERDARTHRDKHGDPQQTSLLARAGRTN